MQASFVFLIMALILGNLSINSVFAYANEFKGVSGKAIVKGKPQLVWQAIRYLRKEDADAVRIISHCSNEDVLEETFNNLPVIGHAKCQYKEMYKPYERIDYAMIASDHFKAFEGSWQLTPINNNKTIVQLSSFVDTGLSIPFARQITNMSTMHNVHKRLREVKRIVESGHIAMAHQLSGSAGISHPKE